MPIRQQRACLPLLLARSGVVPAGSLTVYTVYIVFRSTPMSTSNARPRIPTKSASPTARKKAPVPQPAPKRSAAAKKPPVRKKEAPAAKTPPQSKAKPQVPAVPEAAKLPKTKLVRDSFTMPKPEYQVIDALKLRSVKAGRPLKKSEVLRAGIKALVAMSDAAFAAAIADVPILKTGRPKSKKPASPAAQE